ncbi:MAG TPA: DUF1385 domain-containing protein [Pyrinomonadaceae bacterium]|nr:DUF1385 domain-containing protein [Pyrinomonadaceae bacterium]
MKNKNRKIKFLNLFLGLQKDLIVGGQAVMEGVMMRTPSAYAIACRKSDGSIVTTAEVLPKWSDKYKWLNLPVLRGGATLIQSMALGIKALNFSAEVAHADMEAQEAKEKSKNLETQTVLAEGTTDEDFTKAPVKVTMPEKSKAKKPAQTAGAVGSIIFALFFNALLFIVAPLVLTNVLFIWLGWAAAPEIATSASWFETLKSYVWEVKPASWVAFNLIDGLVRMLFFVIMIFSMSYLKDIRRVFEYHGAEHKTVFTWEKDLELTPDNATYQKRQHPRCGTSFLMVVMIVAIVLFSVIKFDALWLNLVVRIALMPLVAGLSYEIIRYAAKKESSAIFKFMTLPGIWLQNITTQEPDKEQLEVAIRALKESLKLEPSNTEDVPVNHRELEVVV